MQVGSPAPNGLVGPVLFESMTNRLREGPGGLASITLLSDSLGGCFEACRSIVALAGCIDLRKMVERPHA